MVMLIFIVILLAILLMVVFALMRSAHIADEQVEKRMHREKK